MYGVPSFIPPHVQNTTNKDHHRALRKALSPGFSDASLRAQEPMITKYIDLLIQRLKTKSLQGPVNVELWFRYVVFDIICDLAFGESFQCLESDGLHPWIVAMVEGGKPMGILTALNMYPTLAAIMNPLLGYLAKGNLHLHGEMVKPLVEKRIQMGDRPDLMNPLIKLYGDQVSLIPPHTILSCKLTRWLRVQTWTNSLPTLLRSSELGLRRARAYSRP